MTKSLNVLAFAAAFGVLAALPGVAQALTINGCSSPTWEPTSSTLTCGGVSTPSCAVTLNGGYNGDGGHSGDLDGDML